MPDKKKILFVCTGNSARSQMAEGFARHLGGESLEVYSAGLEPKGLNPRAVLAMKEKRIDISGQHSKDLGEVPWQKMNLVITLCGDARDRCPAFSKEIKTIHWDLEDPARAKGSEDEVMDKFREIRDKIEVNIRELIRAKV